MNFQKLNIGYYKTGLTSQRKKKKILRHFPLFRTFFRYLDFDFIDLFLVQMFSWKTSVSWIRYMIACSLYFPFFDYSDFSQYRICYKRCIRIRLDNILFYILSCFSLSLSLPSEQSWPIKIVAFKHRSLTLETTWNSLS